MKKSRKDKGITLIALIITIVVLLILALVTINAIQGDGDLIAYANNAGTKYTAEGKNENTFVQDSLAKMLEVTQGSQKTYSHKVWFRVIDISALKIEYWGGKNTDFEEYMNQMLNATCIYTIHEEQYVLTTQAINNRTTDSEIPFLMDIDNNIRYEVDLNKIYYQIFGTNTPDSSQILEEIDGIKVEGEMS